MSLDITFTSQRDIVCPRCGEVVATKTVDEVSTGGRSWYDFLESIGYYVPESEWYAQDMVLAKEQAMAAYFQGGPKVKNLIANALLCGDHVVVNADW